MEKKGKVMAAMSGGVDSALTAALLLEQGYEVVGLTMDTGDHHVVEEARLLAKNLGIPHLYLDVAKEFQQQVIGNFLSEYRNGCTPNPCIFCNKHIKFGLLFDFAFANGADYFATGHYAKVIEEKGRYLLYRSQNHAKDQSYVLYSLSQKVLSKLLLPLADYEKSQVRQKAAQLGLAAANKPDSQDICFIPDGDYRAFLAGKGFFTQPGDFVDLTGKKLGRHQGISNYTVGQRKGLGIALGHPVYVIGINASSNQVILGTANQLYQSSFFVTNCNFIPFDQLTEPVEALVRVRYQSQGAAAMLEPIGAGQVKVTFAQPEKSITPGQSAVFYQGDMVLGGGIIQTNFC